MTPHSAQSASRGAARRALAVAALVAGAVGATACNDLLSPSDAFYTIAVDSVTGPDTVTAGRPYVQRLWGPVGTTACASVNRLFIRPGATATEIQVQGRHAPGECLQSPVYMQGEPVNLTAPTTAGEHIIRVLRPGTTLVRTVIVK